MRPRTANAAPSPARTKRDARSGGWQAVCGLASLFVLACRPGDFDGLDKGVTASDSEVEMPAEGAVTKPTPEHEAETGMDANAGIYVDAGMDANAGMNVDANMGADAGMDASLPREEASTGAAQASPEQVPHVASDAASDAPSITSQLDLDAMLPDARETSVMAEAATDAQYSDAHESGLPEATVEPARCLGSRSDPMTCGCDRDCAALNALGVCSMGRCVRTCLHDFDDCNLDLDQGLSEGQDGCETDLRTNDGSCNACGRRCTTEQARFVSCQDKLCKPLSGLTPMQLRVFDRCLEVRGAGSANGTVAEIRSCGDHLPQQEWAETPFGELRGLDNKCLDVRGPYDLDATAVQIWDCVRASQQTWKLNNKGQLVGIFGRCLQVRDGIDADGQEVEMQPCEDIPAQRWRVVSP
jgi:hypothetical protein